MEKRDKPKREEPLPEVRFRGLSRLVMVISLMLSVFVFIALIAMGRGVVEKSGVKGGGARNLPDVLKEAYDRGYDVELTEVEVNAYLGRVIRGEQSGVMSGLAKFERVWVNFSEGYGELVLERRVFGVRVTQSAYFRIEQWVKPDGGPDTQVAFSGPAFLEGFPDWKQGGRIGRLPVPQGFVMLMMPSLQRLAGLFSQPADGGGWESDLKLGSMARVSLHAGKIVCAPESASMGIPKVKGP